MACLPPVLVLSESSLNSLSSLNTSSFPGLTDLPRPAPQSSAHAAGLAVLLFSAIHLIAFTGVADDRERCCDGNNVFTTRLHPFSPSPPFPHLTACR